MPTYCKHLVRDTLNRSIPPVSLPGIKTKVKADMNAEFLMRSEHTLFYYFQLVSAFILSILGGRSVAEIFAFQKILVR